MAAFVGYAIALWCSAGMAFAYVERAFLLAKADEVQGAYQAVGVHVSRSAVLFFLIGGVILAAPYGYVRAQLRRLL